MPSARTKVPTLWFRPWGGASNKGGNVKPIRWSGEDDRYFGPFTYCRSHRESRLTFILGSGDCGDGDETPQCRLHMAVGRHTLIVALPAILKPHREKYYPRTLSQETRERLGRDWWWTVTEREYGFSYSNGFLQVFHGVQTHDSETDKTWSYFLPWTQKRFQRLSLYRPDGSHFWTSDVGNRDWDESRRAEEDVPKEVFVFEDYDGEVIEATVHINEREWRHGTGKFKWLSWFIRPQVQRAIAISFSKEVGPEKGSWKGGAIGTGVNMEPDDTPMTAFRKYCQQNKMTLQEPIQIWFK